MKNIYLLSFAGEDNFIPVLWPSAKTYYEKYGLYPERYNWVLPVLEFYDDLEDIKNFISKTPPSIFGVSLYVWNFEKTLEICQWVKRTFPECLIITGGPHQYFKHSNSWFSKHDFIDASLPSEVYGEIAIADILNNFTSDNTVDWNKVEKIVYPSKNKTVQMQSPKSTYQLEFKWDFSAFETQQEFIKQYVDEFNEKKKTALHAKLETTRGCPYQCTFCDWGGGVGTKVIKKDLRDVKKDIDVLIFQKISSLYICDANFGINGDRDVEIIEYIAQKKKSSEGEYFPNIQYGGFAKTNKHFDFLKKIFKIEAENQLSYVYKISLQSFDPKILENVKRTDLRSHEHWELANWLRETYRYDAFVELIIGLPGTTRDSWFREFDVPYEEDVLVRAYEWHLLPEAESYSDKYRKQFGLGTAKKLMNSQPWSIPSEIIVESNSYSRQDYKDMMIAYTAYNLFVQGGIFNDTIKNLLKEQHLTFGQFLKSFTDDCYPELKASLDSIRYYDQHLDKFIFDGINDSQLTIAWNDCSDKKIILWAYFILEYFYKFDKFNLIITTWLLNLGSKKKLVEKESLKIHSIERMNTSRRVFLTKVSYNNFQNELDLLKDANGIYQYFYGNILIGDQSLF
jgi:putative methyltransferase